MSECHTDFDFDAMCNWATHQPDKFGEFRNVLIGKAISGFCNVSSGCELQSRIDSWQASSATQEGYLEHLSMQLGLVVDELSSAVAMIEALASEGESCPVSIDRSPG